MSDVVVGRQPIFDRGATVHGYELVCHPAGGGHAAGAAKKGELLSVEALVTTVTSGINRLVGSRDLYLRVSRELLVRDLPFVLPPERTVLEVGTQWLDGAVDDSVVERCRRLRSDGFRLAVDHATLADGPPELADLATTVKVDVRDAEIGSVTSVLASARQRKMVPVAVNIDLRQELIECDRLGFALFQGHLLARPTILPGRSLDPGRLATLQLAATMLDAEVEMAKLEDVVRSDPELAHQLLSLAGMGAAGGMRRTVRSVREALVLVGWRRLQSWVALLLMAGTGSSAAAEEVTLALVRARACELVAQVVAPGLADAAFTAGMVSTFDLMLHVDLAEALSALPLDPVVRTAVLDHEGPLGAIVADVIEMQFGHFDSSRRSGVDDSTAQRALFNALTWSVQAAMALEGGASPTGAEPPPSSAGGIGG